jgi:RHS repeat-associated protein
VIFPHIAVRTPILPKRDLDHRSHSAGYELDDQTLSPAIIYDGFGLRVAKKSSATSCTSGTVTKLYWRSLSGDALAETDGSGTTQNEYVFFAGRRIASRDGSGHIFYYFADQLGSTRTITTGSGPGQTPGQLCYDADFTPYGREISFSARLQTTACPPSYKFTGYERDTETGLDYAFARYYTSRLGRFLSTDRLGGFIGDPQSHNSYAYTRNNPLNFVDPSGMSDCPDLKIGCMPSDDCLSGFCGASGVDLFGGGCHHADFWGEDCAAIGHMLDPSGRGDSQLRESELAWLASGSIPWYVVWNEHILLLSAYSISAFLVGDLEGGVYGYGANGILQEVAVFDLGPATTNTSGGNSSWAFAAPWYFQPKGPGHGGPYRPNSGPAEPENPFWGNGKPSEFEPTPGKDWIQRSVYWLEAVA